LRCAEHFGTAILPARPRRPQDKAKVEVGVQVVERWILARLRHQVFFSLGALNHAIADLLIDLNNRPLQEARWLSPRMVRSNRPAGADGRCPLRPTSTPAFKPCRVNIDYHVEVDGALLQRAAQPGTPDRRGAHHRLHRRDPARRQPRRQPCTLIGQGPATRRWPNTCRRHTARTWNGRRTASSAGPPTSGRPPLRWSSTCSADRPHPEMGYRSCLGLLSLARHYGHVRLEAACTRAIAIGSRNPQVGAVDPAGRPRPAAAASATQPQADWVSPDHDNLRGPAYYLAPPTTH
jgi:transposase